MALAARTHRSRNPIAAEDRIAGWMFLLPALVIFAVFIIGPILYVFWLSFHQWSVITPEKPWVGLQNYRKLFSGNRDFEIALRNTVWFAIGVVPTQTILGLLLAVLANRKIKGKTFFRTAFYFPSISSSVVISIIFLWLYAQNGLLNAVLHRIGLPTPTPPWISNPRGVIEMALGSFGIHHISLWLAGPSVALLSIMMMNVWTTMGTMMVVFLAGLQDIPPDVYEAAALDGATRTRQFIDITVPLLRPVIFFVLTLGIIGTFQVFDQIFVMTSGGPAKTTTTLAYLVYQEGFGNFSMGYASAIAVVLFFMILIIFLIQRRIVANQEPM
jgi:multiple sugar transport system permease protein